jgi:hypothetical protein
MSFNLNRLFQQDRRSERNVDGNVDYEVGAPLGRSEVPAARFCETVLSGSHPKHAGAGSGLTEA